MSVYKAIICCEKCGQELAEIEAYHESRTDLFVPQDIALWKYSLPDRFCQNCFNKKSSG